MSGVFHIFLIAYYVQSFEMSDEFSTTRLYVGNLEAPSQDSTAGAGQDDTEPGIHLFISIFTHFISID